MTVDHSATHTFDNFKTLVAGPEGILTDPSPESEPTLPVHEDNGDGFGISALFIPAADATVADPAPLSAALTPDVPSPSTPPPLPRRMSPAKLNRLADSLAERRDRRLAGIIDAARDVSDWTVQIETYRRQAVIEEIAALGEGKTPEVAVGAMGTATDGVATKAPRKRKPAGPVVLDAAGNVVKRGPGRPRKNPLSPVPGAAVPGAVVLGGGVVAVPAVNVGESSAGEPPFAAGNVSEGIVEMTATAAATVVDVVIEPVAVVPVAAAEHHANGTADVGGEG